MKQGLKFRLPVQFNGIHLDDVQSIRFRFQQGAVQLDFDYPSARTVRSEGTDTVELVWTPEETFLFRAGDTILMDTHVVLTGSAYNPETNIVRMTMSPTLFYKSEVV